MAKTVSQLTSEELKQYDPTRNLDRGLDPERWAKVQLRLPKLSALLRDQFGAKCVKLFGSAVVEDEFTQWSDIDLAVWDIPPERFYKAVWALNDLSPDIKVDLVDMPTCGSLTLKQIIEEEGIEI